MNFTRRSFGFSQCFDAQLTYIGNQGLHIMKKDFQPQHRGEETRIQVKINGDFHSIRANSYLLYGTVSNVTSKV
jgi:hypothetical protein